MKYLKNIKGEYAFGAVIFLLYFWMQLQAWQIVYKSSFYAQNVAKAPAFAHVAGFIFFGASVLWTVLTAGNSNRVAKDTIINVLIIFGLAVLSLCSYAGFVFDVA